MKQSVVTLLLAAVGGVAGSSLRMRRQASYPLQNSPSFSSFSQPLPGGVPLST